MLLLVVIWSIAGSFADRAKWWRAANAAAFVCGVSVIVYMTVYSRAGAVPEAVLMPFQIIAAAKDEPEYYRSMLMNVFLFVPLGLTLPNAFPEKWSTSRKLRTALLFGMCFSVFIECSQYCFGLGRCETDDVIMNTLGMAVGVSHCFVKRIPKSVKMLFVNESPD